MTVNFDPSEDFAAAADGTETVTLLRRGSSDQTVLSGALRRAMTTQEARVRNRYDTWKLVASDGRVTAADLVWHLPAGQLSDAPRLGDAIVDADGRRWTVLDVQLATLRTRWQCGTRDLAVAYGLDDTVTILKATYTKGDGGAAEATWLPWKTGIRARVQPAAADVDTQHRARRTIQRYRIFMEEDVALDPTHCIRGSDGTIYKIRGTVGAERIGQLQTVDVEVTPWPAS